MFCRLDIRRFCGLLSLLLVLLITTGAWAQANELVLHFIDVGQGDSILIQTPAGASILIDAGDTRAGTQTVVPYLRKMGIKSLDMVVLTHPHFDHVGGLIPVLEEYPVDQVLADGQIHTTQAYEDLLGLIYEKGISFKLARAGDELDIPGLDKVVVLNPQEPFLPGLNNNSVVLELHHGTIAVLLAGDIEAAAEERILAEGYLSEAQILKAAHHGSKTSSTRVFLRKVKPAIGVVSVGAGNRYGLPDKKVIETMNKAGIEVLRTDLLGTIIVVSDGSSYRVVDQEELLFGKPQSKERDTSVSSTKLVNVNTAAHEQLMQLPGIGDVLARRIIEAREAAAFQKPEDLLRVAGIGPKRLEKLVSLITF